MGKVYVGDTGTEIILDCGTDVSNALSWSIFYISPNGQTGEWAARPVVGEPTKIKYKTKSGDLSIPGAWKVHAKVVLPNWSGLGEMAEFTIYRIGR